MSQKCHNTAEVTCDWSQRKDKKSKEGALSGSAFLPSSEGGRGPSWITTGTIYRYRVSLACHRFCRDKPFTEEPRTLGQTLGVGRANLHKFVIATLGMGASINDV